MKRAARLKDGAAFQRSCLVLDSKPPMVMLCPFERGRSMPAYYFHIRNSGILIRDPDGVELSDLNAARAECLRLILSVLREEQIDEQLSSDRQFEVEDESGRTILIVPFHLALSLDTGRA